MKAQIVTTATLFALFTAVLPASAADPQLLNLVMPDAKILAGVNVEQAKGTPFGQYVLTQVQSGDPKMQELIALTGFDPTRDVREALVATNGGEGSGSGLALARGNFDVARITTLATSKGAATEDYHGVIILEDPKQSHGLAFLDSTLVVAGDIASVKGALDRQRSPQPIPAGLAVKVNQLSAAQDAWVISAVAPASLVKPHGQQNPAQAAFQNVQQASGGVKFGNQVVFTGSAQADTAQNASSLGDVVKLMVNLAQMQSGNNPQVAQLAQAVAVTTSGNVLNVTLTLPEDQFQQLIKLQKKAGQAAGARRAARVNPERK